MEVKLTSELLAEFLGGQVLILEEVDSEFDELRGKLKNVVIFDGIIELEFEWLARRRRECWRNTGVYNYKISQNGSKAKKVSAGVEIDFHFKGIYIRFYSANDPSNIAREKIEWLA